jgi:hypothetical protein
MLRRVQTTHAPQIRIREPNQYIPTEAGIVEQLNTTKQLQRDVPSPLAHTIEQDDKYIQQQNAIIEYQTRVKATSKRALQCTQQRRQQLKMDLQFVHECFHYTNTSSIQQLVYPIDADVHYNEIRMALAQYAQHSNHKMHIAKQYTGPWIENVYINYFESLYDNDNNQLCLHDVFGPFIPIFIPWVDHLVVAASDPQQGRRRRHQYPGGLVRTLQEVLRPNVPYITISQNDEGIVGKYEFNSTTTIPNLLVLSAGGYGHVPIPLLKQEEPFISDRIPMTDRKYDVSYVGSLKNAPRGMRRKMHEILLRYNATTSTENDHHRSFRYEYYYGPDWRSVVQDSKFSLVPRGYGRSAYHLMEVLQMGYIPIYVYLTNDTPWIPYMDIFVNEIGYMTDVDHLQELLYYLHHNVTNAELQFREERISVLRNTHFTINGVVMNQMQQFMMANSNKLRNQNSTDLLCQGVPSTLTGKDL